MENTGAEFPKNNICIQMMAQKLDNKDFLGKSDPFYIVSKRMPNQEWCQVYKSEVIKNTLNPKWSTMKITYTKLCDGDYDRDLKISIFDHDSGGNNDLIGEFTTNFRSLSTATYNQTIYEVLHPTKQKNSGIITVGQFYEEEVKEKEKKKKKKKKKKKYKYGSDDSDDDSEEEEEDGEDEEEEDGDGEDDDDGEDDEEEEEEEDEEEHEEEEAEEGD